MEQQKEADDLPSLTPEVKWAQNPEAISLTVSIGSIMRPEIKINGNTLEFSASGVGAQDRRCLKDPVDYETIVLCSSII